MLSSFFSSTIQLLSLLFLASNYLPLVSAVYFPSDTPACRFSTDRSGPLGDWQKQDRSKGQTIVTKTELSLFQNGGDDLPDVQLKLFEQELSLWTNLPRNGRLRMINITTTNHESAFVYIGNADECRGSIKESGITEESPILATAVIQTLQGGHKDPPSSS